MLETNELLEMPSSAAPEAVGLINRNTKRMPGAALQLVAAFHRPKITSCIFLN